MTLPPTATPQPTFAPPTVSPIPAVTDNQAQTNASDGLRGDGFIQAEAPADEATLPPELPVNVILLGIGVPAPDRGRRHDPYPAALMNGRAANFCPACGAALEQRERFGKVRPV